MKTKYLIPQTEAIALLGEMEIMIPNSPGAKENPSAPARGGFAPGGGDLGGVPAN